jgi:hypothetical protein
MRVRMIKTCVFQLLILACGLSLAAQSAPAQTPPPNPQAAPSDSLNWVPSGLQALTLQSFWHTSFTFDRGMLALAGDLTHLDPPTKQALARLNGVAVHLFRFRNARYEPDAVQSIRAQYAALGWKHIVSADGQPGNQPRSGNSVPGRTDVWLDTHGANPSGAAILLAGPTNVDLIVISGDIDTLDLLHLRGHFGIPRFPDSRVTR